MGARALRAIMEEIMLPVMYDAPDHKAPLTITKAHVNEYIEAHLSKKLQLTLQDDPSHNS